MNIVFTSKYLSYHTNSLLNFVINFYIWDHELFEIYHNLLLFQFQFLYSLPNSQAVPETIKFRGSFLTPTMRWELNDYSLDIVDDNRHHLWILKPSEDLIKQGKEWDYWRIVSPLYRINRMPKDLRTFVHYEMKL